MEFDEGLDYMRLELKCWLCSEIESHFKCFEVLGKCEVV